ncbi:MAG: OstA-like protein [Bacteroidia bacterium]|nr:OstA-like protein [Bacteroidia bacterium]
MNVRLSPAAARWLCLLLLLPGQLLAQGPAPLPPDTTNPNRIHIIYADLLSYESRDGQGLQKLIGRVQLRQDSTYFFCDSAYYYEDINRMEAFSRVRVEMPDSVYLYAKRIEYDGNTRIAEVYQNIRLTDTKSTLTTQRLTYDRNLDYGYYRGGGKLVDGESVLTSQYGYYYPNEDKAYFKQQVVLTHPDYTLLTDTLAYNTETKVATFVTYTLIKSEDGDIETRSGTYDTEAGKVNLLARSTVRDTTYTLTADTLNYSDNNNLGLARGRVIVQENDSTLEIRGNYGLFNRERKESMLTEDPVAIQYFDDDTLYIFADTLMAVTLERTGWRGPAPDTLTEGTWYTDTAGLDSSLIRQLTPDTVEFRVFRAWKQVRFFMNQMQGRADSMVYRYDDSVIYLYQAPILWSEENQLTGDTIAVWMKNNQADSLWVSNNCFLASEADTVGYNQIKGQQMQAKFRDNQLSRLFVQGNSESIYFIKNDADTVRQSYQGMNKALSQAMRIEFEDNEVAIIVFLAKPEGTFFPMYEALQQNAELEGLSWKIGQKPVRPVLAPAETVPPGAPQAPPALAPPAAPLPPN